MTYLDNPSALRYYAARLSVSDKEAYSAMPRYRRIVCALLIVLTLLAGCDVSAPAATPTPAPTAAVAPSPTVAPPTSPPAATPANNSGYPAPSAYPAPVTALPPAPYVPPATPTP